MTSYKLHDLSNPLKNITKQVIKPWLIGSYLAIGNVFMTFLYAYLQSLNILHFQRGHIIIEMAIILSEKIWGKFSPLKSG